MVVIADIGKDVERLVISLGRVYPLAGRPHRPLVEETFVSMDVLGRNSTLRMNGEIPL